MKEGVFAYAKANSSYLSQANLGLISRLHPLIKKQKTKKKHLVN